jgi:hypothetical protein
MKSLKLFIILIAIIFTFSYTRTRSLTRRHRTTGPGEVRYTQFRENTEITDAYYLKILKTEKKIQFTSNGEEKSVNINEEDDTISSVSAKFEKKGASHPNVQGLLTITILRDEDQTTNDNLDFKIDDTTENIFSFLKDLDKLIDLSSDPLFEVTATKALWKASNDLESVSQWKCKGSCKLKFEPTKLFMITHDEYVDEEEYEVDFSDVVQAQFFEKTKSNGKIQGILKVTERLKTKMEFDYFNYYYLDDEKTNIDALLKVLNFLTNPERAKPTEKLTQEALGDDEVPSDWTRRLRKIR